MRLRGPALGHLPHNHSLCNASLEHAARQHAHRLGVVRGAGLAHDVGARGELAAEACKIRIRVRVRVWVRSGCDLSVEAWRREGKVGLDLGLG